MAGSALRRLFCGVWVSASAAFFLPITAQSQGEVCTSARQGPASVLMRGVQQPHAWKTTVPAAVPAKSPPDPHRVGTCLTTRLSRVPS